MHGKVREVRVWCSRHERAASLDVRHDLNYPRVSFFFNFHVGVRDCFDVAGDVVLALVGVARQRRGKMEVVFVYVQALDVVKKKSFCVLKRDEFFEEVVEEGA